MKICMLIFDQYLSDVRIDKEKKTLNENGYDCFVLSFGKEERANSKKIKLKSKRRIIRVIEFIYKAYFALKKENVSVIHAHDFMALPIAFILAKFLKVNVIFDAHELYHEINNGKRIKKIIFRFILPKIYHTFTVSPSIAEIYSKEFGISNVSILRNTPNYELEVHLNNTNLLKKSLYIDNNKKVLLFQGYIVKNRGIEKLIKILSYLDNEFVIVLMGKVETDYKNELLELMGKMHLEDRVYFKSAVPYSEIPQYSSGADLGVFFHENKSLNHYHCLPNKIFEYITSRIPVLVVNFPDMSKLILENHFGDVVSENSNEQEVASKILGIFIEENYSKYKENLNDKYKRFTWKEEERVLLDVYNRMRP